jgi:hypothetical protein
LHKFCSLEPDNSDTFVSSPLLACSASIPSGSVSRFNVRTALCLSPCAAAHEADDTGPARGPLPSVAGHPDAQLTPRIRRNGFERPRTPSVSLAGSAERPAGRRGGSKQAARGGDVTASSRKPYFSRNESSMGKMLQNGRFKVLENHSRFVLLVSSSSKRVSRICRQRENF